MDFMPYEFSYLLFFAGLVLMCYALIQKKNIVANIPASLIAFIMFGILSLYFVNGKTMEWTGGVWTDWESGALSILCILLALLNLGFCALMVLRALVKEDIIKMG